MMIIGIDPGSEQTAYALVAADYSVAAAEKLPNDEFLGEVLPGLINSYAATVVIEGIQSYGKPFGKTVIETCYIVGECRRIAILHDAEWCIYPRPEYARALIGGMKINDALIRGALMTRFGGDKKGEPLHLLKGNSDKRSACAVAVYHLDRVKCGAI